MNTIIKILAMALLVIGLVGCQSSEVPPTPDSPGGVAGEYSVAVEDLGTWANPAVGFSLWQDEAFINPLQPYSNITGTVNEGEVWTWSQIHVYNYNNEEWTMLELPAQTYKGTNWISTEEENLWIGAVVDKTFLGENLVAAYTCSKPGSSFDCHGGWQVEGFNVSKETLEDISVNVEVSGTQDDSIIVIDLKGNPYTPIKLGRGTPMNTFYSEESSVEYEQDKNGLEASLTPTKDNFNGKSIVLRGNWENAGPFRLIVGGSSNWVDETTQIATVTGNITLSLPDAPKAIGVEEDADLDEGLLLHYEFNEEDTYNTVGDVSINDGIAEFNFNGYSGGVVDPNYIRTGLEQDGNIRTMSMWVNYKQFGERGRDQLSGVRNGPYLGYWKASTRDEFNFRFGTSSASLKIEVTDQGDRIDLNKWHMVTMTATENDQGSYTINGYVDGVKVNEEYYSYSTTAPYDGKNSNLYISNQDLWIGATNNNGAPFGQLDAFVDNVRIYDRPLSDSQVTELYNLEKKSGIPAPSSTP